MSTGSVDFDDAVFGEGLPGTAARCIAEAGLFRSADPERALELLRYAQALAPEHPATLIALYRFYFYGHRLEQARAVALEAIALGAQALDLPARWQDVPALELTGPREDPRTRFYLFSLKGYAYLSLRLGDIAEGDRALALLRQLDPHDRVGAALLVAVSARGGRDEDDEADVPAAVNEGVL